MPYRACLLAALSSVLNCCVSAAAPSATRDVAMPIVEHVKRCVIGSGSPFPSNNLHGDKRAPCQWDCYRRASMLEPMAEAIFRDIWKTRRRALGAEHPRTFDAAGKVAEVLLAQGRGAEAAQTLEAARTSRGASHGA